MAGSSRAVYIRAITSVRCSDWFVKLTHRYRCGAHQERSSFPAKYLTSNVRNYGYAVSCLSALVLWNCGGMLNLEEYLRQDVGGGSGSGIGLGMHWWRSYQTRRSR
ncbi:uncharacterized protein LOC110836614 isoform X2 [Zootermopsis nevadensis]|uniref:uncharacterized protein LOC110836614 isoform X2 n=1 Tax=Zootermopsis nevadensis TaxID=136037 RepID=UPI000B8EE36A|nr:uncharacterized protein LOC110836614 isoform X2 [Zootermopsis nevadensis]